MNDKKQTKIIKVDYLARVEGEGALYVKVNQRRVEEVKLKIFEPPRFFEAFLRGRHFLEAPDITARICGICPIAYELGASYAMEDICGVKVTGPLRALRRLIYDGEWIESHVLHIFMLHAPDFLGYEDALRMAKDHPELVKNALRMKKIGNQIMVLLGGREIHPINLRVGGFYKVPKKRELQTLSDDLKWGLDTALASAKVLAKLPFPDFEQDYEFVAMHHPDEYAIIEGRLVSNKGFDIPLREYDRYLVEEHVPHSTALHTVVKGRGSCMVGPLARYSLNFEQLTPLAKQTAREAGLGPTCQNPFKSILVRAVETVYAFDEALQIVKDYEEPDRPAFDVTPRAGTGYGCTEAPRGICYHRYTIDDQGTILDAKIVSPTAVNQKRIEDDLRHFVEPNVDLPDKELQWKCEQAIRNYDPCISCSAHFLKLEVDRTHPNPFPISKAKGGVREGGGTVLIVGYGNSMRSDDGVGIYVASRLAEEKSAGVEVRLMHQLHLELLEELIQYEKIIFVDAAEQGPEVILQKVEPKPQEISLTSSHQLSPAVIYQLALQVYRKKLDLLVCTIRGENFDFGSLLSPVVLDRARRAVTLIRSVIARSPVLSKGNASDA